MKSYSFKEYKLISENDYTLIEKFLNNLILRTYLPSKY